MPHMDLVRLVPQETNQRVSPPAERVIGQHYACRNLAEMYSALKLVVEDRQDPRRDVRVSAAKDAGLYGNNAAERIFGYWQARDVAHRRI